MNPITGQILLVGTAVSEGFDARVAKGARCPMICVMDCDRLSALGRLSRWETDDGIDAGRMLDETLGASGWTDIRVRACLPVADKADGWEPELEALIGAAARLGVAHMVFEPAGEAPARLH